MSPISTDICDSASAFEESKCAPWLLNPRWRTSSCCPRFVARRP